MRLHGDATLKLQQPADDRVFWKRDLASRYDVSRETVWRWQQSGKLPPPDVRIGNRYGWRAATIRAHETVGA